jgi:predicted RNase H-like HicB family nuclease
VVRGKEAKPGGKSRKLPSRREELGVFMTLREDISVAVNRGEMPPPLEVTVLFREVSEESEKYVVAECLEIPGCISQGMNQAEAEANIKNAIEACVVVMCSDAMKRAMEFRTNQRDLRGISSQRRMTICQPPPELAYA